MTSGPTHRSSPSDRPNRVRCDAVLPVEGLQIRLLPRLFYPFLEILFVELFLRIRVLIRIASTSLPVVGFSSSRTKRLEQKGVWMSEHLVWEIESRFTDSIFVQNTEADIVRHAHSHFLLLSIHRSPHGHLINRTAVLIGEVLRRSTHAIHQIIRSVSFDIDKVQHIMVEIAHR